MQNDEFIKFEASTLESIDTGLYNWVNSVLDVYTKTNKGIYKVPPCNNSSPIFIMETFIKKNEKDFA